MQQTKSLLFEDLTEGVRDAMPKRYAECTYCQKEIGLGEKFTRLTTTTAGPKQRVSCVECYTDRLNQGIRDLKHRLRDMEEHLRQVRLETIGF
jgi:hypothetical protein